MHDFNSTEGFMTRRSAHVRRNLLLSALICLVLGLAIGLLIGRFATCPEESEGNVQGVFLPGVSDKIVQDGDPTISEEIISSINPDNIRNYLRDLSEFPHLAGTDADYRQAKELQDFWKQEGLDEAFLTPYDVLLSYPNVTDDDMMNRIELLNDTDGIVYQSPLREKILYPTENKSDVVPSFNAYSAPGDIVSERLVYVNYGRLEDYRWLKNNTSVNITGAIVIARYGKIFRGDKVHLASEYGAIGIIIYSDPADYTLDGSTLRVYPEDWWLPPSGAQRGTIFRGLGDPLTPGYPATETAYRYGEDSREARLPTIPAHPVGYGIGQKLLGAMAGDEVPADWKGTLNITYRLGGRLNTAGWKIRMFISTQNSMRRTYNAFGIIRGSIEPDRYVLMGNHRDAWVFGAIDPSSGTATMMEVSRVMGNLVKQGRWRPRRTIIFCSWGSEEYGLLGSNEWVEQYVKNLGSRSVAYVNVDIAVTGNFSFRASGTPLMYQSMFDATRQVPNPDGGDVQHGLHTVYDKWRTSFPGQDKSKPYMGTLGAGSDYAGFVQLAGIPCVSVHYSYDMNTYKIGSYPLYHTVYETFYAVDQLIDRGFKRHQAVAQTTAELMRNLADSLIVPFDVTDFANNLQTLVNTLDSDYGALLRSQGIRFDWIKQAADNFSSEAATFKTLVENVNKNDPFAIRRINDQLILMERAFMDPAGLPGRPQSRHILFAESSVNSYAGSSFPGLVDSLFEIETIPEAEAVARWEIVKHHFSVIVFTINSAQSTLREVSSFMPEFNGKP
ncbi:N-acetylated-alpha-linked acidic dipeptidase 2-like [Pecten maximus]|uniref:N-acetylated-alpha-linked acidic dipeptidase 2-like n=1 Tax=Pecten maximus TaxID=6579 RepID=UPI00145877A8|nr:N-acetylated-alpha-linked acidic dipeptidase 2-like [Pecten maximus]